MVLLLEPNVLQKFMAETELIELFGAELWLRPGMGPRYEQLYRYVAQAIRNGGLGAGLQLPPEREIATRAGLSRVTVRKAFAKLVESGLVSQRRGSGTFVNEPIAEDKLEHVLSTLTSFTDYMRRRGISPESRVLLAGRFAPNPTEMMALGLGVGESVARVQRLRTADGTPMAIETSSLPTDILPNPSLVGASLYDVLDRFGRRPVRATQRINACNIAEPDAGMMGLPVASAVLKIDRTSYLQNGRPIEYTTGFYRSDIYDFVAELRLDARRD
jgi:GntR family transcriptional regulator